MTTNIENIKPLLARFYEGLTTTDEERVLADFFRQDNIPDDLLADRQLFLSLCEIADQPMPEDIAAEIDTFVRNLANEPAIQPQAASRPKLASIKKFRTPPKIFYRAAAMVAILLTLSGGIGGGILHYTQHNTPFRDTCANAEEAAEQILYASEIINRSFAPFRQSAGSAATQIDNINKTINQANKYIKL